jgi:hypothetical protein
VTGFRVRRLAVIDLHGRSGSAVRLWLVRAEFPVAAALFIAFAVLFADHGTLTGWVLGIVFVGIGCNYLVLTAWMLILRDRQRLSREFLARDVGEDSHLYRAGQARLLVPFLFLYLASRPGERRV